MIIKPIWEDTTYTDRTRSGVFFYHITTKEKVGVNERGEDVIDDVIIFNGKAWTAPNEIYTTININHICQDYLSTSLPDLREITSATTTIHKDAYREFTLWDENENVLEIYRFLLDWSYETKSFDEDINMAQPINGHYVPNMLKMATYWESNDESVRTTISYNTNDVVWEDDVLYNKEMACGDWAVYYSNRKGGWDSFLLEGNVKRTDNFEKYYINRSYNNTSLEWGKKVYHNEITISYELNTGWLNDRESKILAFNLLSSNQVYLHDLVNNKIIPVVITNDTSEYKTFKNNGRKMINYTINVEASQIQQNINN